MMSVVPQFLNMLTDIQIFIGRRRDTRFQSNAFAILIFPSSCDFPTPDDHNYKVVWEKFDFRLAVHLSHRSFRHIKVPM